MTKQESIENYRTKMHIAVKDGRWKEADRYARKVLELLPALPTKKGVEK